MTANIPISHAAFRVIAGDRKPLKAGARRAYARAGAHPAMDADALAREMARIYALNLLLDVPFADLGDPHRGVGIGAGDRITLHDLQTELCKLSRASHPGLLAAGKDVCSSLSLFVPGDADHPAVRAAPQDGQLRSFLGAAQGAGPVLSAFFDLAPLRAAGPLGGGMTVAGIGEPTQTQPTSHWLRWIAAACGAAPVLAGRADLAVRTIATPRDLATQMHRRHPAQACFAAAIHLLGQRVPLDGGLRQGRDGSGWDGRRVLGLMLEAVRRADRASRRAARGHRFLRPGVVAARWSLMVAGEDVRADKDAVLLRAALAQLEARVPRLLHWMTQLNGALGTRSLAAPDSEGGIRDGWTPVALRQNLMLPQIAAEGTTISAAHGKGQAALAGALVTLLKAAFDTAARTDEATEQRPLETELDLLAANMTMGRSIVGGFYDSENQRGLRLGQGVALALLRETLERDGVPASLELHDLDGRHVILHARRNQPGSVRVSLRVDGAFAAWPDGGDLVTPHLTAVV